MSSNEALDAPQSTEGTIRTFPVPVAPGAMPPFYILPDTLRNWPYERIINPHYRLAEAEAVAWIESFKIFSPSTQKAFLMAKSSLLCAWTFPKASLYDLRSCCDMMNMFFILEEYSDASNMEDTRIYCEATMDAILNPDKPRPVNEPIVGEMARQFWKRASAHAPLAAKERFIKTWRLYLDATIVQASQRGISHKVFTIDEYMTARCDNFGSYPCLAFLEVSLQIDIPDYIMEHPTIVSLNRDTSTMLILANDMCSYKKEILEDDATYNVVTVVMHNKNTDVAGGLQWISDTHDELIKHFLMLRKDVFEKINFPSYGEKLDLQVEAYVDGLGQWIRGQDEWNFACRRYFGDQGLEIQSSRKVVIP